MLLKYYYNLLLNINLTLTLTLVKNCFNYISKLHLSENIIVSLQFKTNLIIFINTKYYFFYIIGLYNSFVLLAPTKA